MPRSSRSFSAYDHFLSLCYAQLTYRESLRDIVTCLSSRPQRRYRMGFRGAPTRTNLAYANEKRDWRVIQSHPVDKQSGLRCDQTIRLTTQWPRKSYPKLLRRVRFRDAEQGRSWSS